uniref:hypothetical protein n=1 Tax=Salmonella enterica TaxID=28901 RepID=UPI0020C46755
RKLRGTRGWANGRDVETLAKRIIGNVYMQQGKSGEKGMMGSLEVTADEVIQLQKGMLRERLSRGDDDGAEE